MKSTFRKSKLFNIDPVLNDKLNKMLKKDKASFHDWVINKIQEYVGE